MVGANKGSSSRTFSMLNVRWRSALWTRAARKKRDLRKKYHPQAVFLFCSAASILIISHKLLDTAWIVLIFWEAVSSVVWSFLLAWPVEPAWTLPDNTSDWVLFFVHCVGSAFFCMLTTVQLFYASVFVSEMSYCTALVFLFLIQWSILHDIAGPPGLYVEVFGAVLVMISSFIVPVYDVVVDKCARQEKTEDYKELSKIH